MTGEEAEEFLKSSVDHDSQFLKNSGNTPISIINRKEHKGSTKYAKGNSSYSRICVLCEKSLRSLR